jgi:hypothetical protein
MSGAAQPPALAVSERKLLAYLLDPSHPIGGPKAAFLLSQGFSPADPLALARALVDHAARSPWRRSPTPHGVKFVFEGVLESPSGKVSRIRSVWMQPHSGGAASLVTAYPL